MTATNHDGVEGARATRRQRHAVAVVKQLEQDLVVGPLAIWPGTPSKQLGVILRRACRKGWPSHTMLRGDP